MGVPQWAGPYPVDISIPIVRGRKWMELSEVWNREKTPIDALVENGIIRKDDWWDVQPVTIDYDPTWSGKKPYRQGARIASARKIRTVQAAVVMPHSCVERLDHAPPRPRSDP